MSFFEQVVGELGERHTLSCGQGGKIGLHVGFEIHRQIKPRVWPTNLPRLPFVKSISAGMSSLSVLFVFMYHRRVCPLSPLAGRGSG
jgi:hypothetical protein